MDKIRANKKGGTSPLIMVVDDDAAIRISIRFSLENYGYTVVEAGSSEDAIESFQSNQPDLILLDVVMDDVDGFQTCASIRGCSGGEHLPIIMVTSLEDETTISKAFESGATDFVVKPLNLTVLGYRIQYWLRSSGTFISLKQSEQQLAKAQKLAKLGHWEWDLDSDQLGVRCSDPKEFGLEEKIAFEGLAEKITEVDRDSTVAIIRGALEGKFPFSVHYSIQMEDGAERVILNQGEFVKDQKTAKWYGLGIVQDITAMRLAEKKIRYLAYYDSLTGLANRSLFREHWKKFNALNDRSPLHIGILFIDLDHFKRINDSLGHSAGDQVLMRVAERLRKILRTSDVISRANDELPGPIISRVGGDEFILLATNLKTPDSAAALAQRIIGAINEPIFVDAQQLNISASIGISLSPDDGNEIDTLLKHADTAMYEAKKAGRNKYEFFHKSMNDLVKARFILQNKLRLALQKREFSLYYQPKYSNTDGEIRGVEALIRWSDPERGLIPPNEFLPFAEENNFIHKINSWVIEEACRQARMWVDAGLFHNCRMGVNISGKDIDFTKLQRTILLCLEKTELDPNYLEIELTERVMMQKTDAAKQMLDNLRKRGVSIAIDDFGTGYSALSHLQVFPLTTLKIDRSFVSGIEEKGNCRTLLLSIINIGKSLNLNVVAEGVETIQQQEALRDMGCDELQGFLLSLPVPASEAEELLAKKS